ncbi:hypothetical protein HJG60_008607 [Phyllostomus discolor]|uniref:Uncharacterized protein n=1 Tax=Phyllostomus discolor TaxID=89673 RepID=A0A834DKF8_9CHIR|nr:hypothetical protein HJG60_008607 [Phyllostomus discolor]
MVKRYVYINLVHLVYSVIQCYNVFVDSFFGRSIHCSQSGVKIPYDECVIVNIFIEVLQDFLYIFRCSYVGCIYVYKEYVLLLDYCLVYYVITFFSFFVAIVLKSVLSDTSVVISAFFLGPLA